ITGVKVSEDGMKARIVVDGLRQYYVHHLFLDGVRERDNYHSLVHPSAYYTLNNIPTGDKLALSELSTKNSSLKREEAPKQEVKAPAKAAEKPAEAPSLEVISPILAKNTCSACHNTDTRQVGP